ncbi:hypothetical protein L1049_003764 [Liquidambar formosana]|uniref:Uncharacterized protein n=1 Tax=Liquidambar formosana TaxID=63359 RepID=A0AAP0RNG8_LIQFO
MQSRLAARSCWVFTVVHRNRALLRGHASGSSTGRTADLAIHSGDLEGIDAEEAAKAGMLPTEHKPNKETEPLVPPKFPISPFPHLESTGVNQPLDPIVQQKRRQNTTTPPAAAAPQDVPCVGVDGTPLPRDKHEWQKEGDYDDDKEYFKHHKASPLSEMEVVDTRKPITQATDCPLGDSDVHNIVVIGWRPEQLDTAEEALRRACEIWRRNAMRGDPDSPHGRILRALRGEYW